jgi:hypothetical protein
MDGTIKLRWLAIYVGLFFSLPTNVLIGQTICKADKLIGEWIYVRQTSHNSSDSFTKKYLDAFLNDSIKDKGWSWSYDTLGKRTQLPMKKRKISYRIDEKNCKILLGKRKNPGREKIHDILYIDEKYLVLEIPNPRSSTNGYFRRK